GLLSAVWRASQTQRHRPHRGAAPRRGRGPRKRPHLHTGHGGCQGRLRRRPTQPPDSPDPRAGLACLPGGLDRIFHAGPIGCGQTKRLHVRPLAASVRAAPGFSRLPGAVPAIHGTHFQTDPSVSEIW
ncbi:hypothetical protein E4U58_001915, partial [Claviceps cyperi]